MTIDADQKALAEFSGRKGEAYRLVLSHKEDISRWMEEGWSIVAIYRLLRSKGMLGFKYAAFRKGIKKVFQSNDVPESKTTQSQEQQDKAIQRHKATQRARPHELQRQQSQKFVTITGVDHIGLDKKDE